MADDKMETWKQPFFKERETEINDFEKAQQVGIQIAKIAKTKKEINSPPNDPTQHFLHDYWNAHKSRPFYCTFLATDLRGFTQLSYEKNAKDIANIISIFSNITGSLTSIAGGYVLKFLGDGIISFFPCQHIDESIKRALLCSYAISKAMHEARDIMHNLGMERIDYGIACDVGHGIVVKIGSPYSKIHYDIIGKPINVSVKIQRLAEKGSIITTENVVNMINNANDEQSISIFKGMFKQLSIEDKRHPSGFIGWMLKTTLFFRSRKPENLFYFLPPEKNQHQKT